MRKKPSTFLIPVIILGFLQGVCAEDASQTNSTPVIVISNLSGSKADVPGWQPAVGQGISEMLIESLESSGQKFQVLETTEATGSQSEPKSGASNSAGGGTKSVTGGSAGSKRSTAGGAASSGNSDASAASNSEKPDASGPTDSDFMFSGEVTQFTIQTNSSKLGDFISSSPFAGLGAKVYTAHVQIEWRLVDSETKKIVKRGITTTSASGSDFDMADLTTPDGKAAMAGSATTFAKTAGGGKKGTNNYANMFEGLILGNTSSGAGGGSAGSSSGTAAKSAKTSTQVAPKGGGGSAGNNSGATASSAKTPSQTTPKAGGDVAGNGGESAGQTISYGNPAFINSALGKATAKAVTDIIKQLDAANLPEPGRVTKVKTANEALKHTPGKVLAVAGKDTIIVSLGSKQGLKTGDTLELYQPSDVLDDKSNVVFTDEKLIGEITLQSVQDDKSRASYAGDALVQQGWTVKAK